MSRYLAYPNLDRDRILEIYNQSRHKRIQGYGYFIDPFKTYMEFFPDALSGGVDNTSRASNFMPELRQQLHAAGLPTSYVILCPTPPRLWIPGVSSDNGWLIILGTGFNKQLHDPEVLNLKERVKAILHTQEEPRWWNMRAFLFPPLPHETPNTAHT